MYRYHVTNQQKPELISNSEKQGEDESSLVLYLIIINNGIKYGIIIEYELHIESCTKKSKNNHLWLFLVLLEWGPGSAVSLYPHQKTKKEPKALCLFSVMNQRKRTRRSPSTSYI